MVCPLVEGVKNTTKHFAFVKGIVSYDTLRLYVCRRCLAVFKRSFNT